MHSLTVIYESGILKPIQPLDLPEGQHLQIQILDTTPNCSPLEQALQPLIQSGALTLPTPNSQSSLPEIIFSSLLDPELETDDIHPQSLNLLSDGIIEDRGPL